jgi:hypothetical protein
MSFTDEELRRAAELKAWAEGRVSELQGELDRLREVLVVVDSVLRKTSFKPASQPAATAEAKKPVSPGKPTAPAPSADYAEIRQLKRSKDSYLLANAYVSPGSVVMIPASDVRLSVGTPPFKAFFLNRILEGMRGKDLDSSSKGDLPPDEALNYEVEDSNGVINRITVKNYREKARLNEILSTATWAFTRMLEKR